MREGHSTPVIRDETHGFDNRDMKLEAVAMAVGALVVFLVCSVLLLMPIFSFDSQQHQLTHSLFSTENPRFDVESMFSQPRLEVFPERELREFREREDHILHTYGWENKNEKTVRIPIEEGMKRFLDKQKGMK